jgi:hypothetical protein
MRLWHGEAGFVIHLNAVPFRVEEVQTQGIAMAHKAFDAYLLGLQPTVILPQIVRMRHFERDLLHDFRSLRHVSPPS